MKTLLFLLSSVMVCAVADAETKPITPTQDKPTRFYVESYKLTTFDEPWSLWYDDYDQFGDKVDSGTLQDAPHIDYHWNDGTNGGGSQSYQASWSDYRGSGSIQWTSQQTWPASFWPDLVYGTQMGSGDLPEDFDTIIYPPDIIWEHCGINFPFGNNWNDVVYWDGTREIGGYSGNYTRTADAVLKLQTGGKAKSGRQSLWRISATATILTPYNAGVSEPLIGFSSEPIADSTSIIVDGENLGSDGNLWRVYADGDTRTLTPYLPGVDYYTFDVNTQKYQLAVSANSVPLDPDGVVPGADFCVGQYITFALGGIPGGVGSTGYHWTLGGDFYNADTNPCPTCSTDPIFNPSLLKSNTTTAWWVSGNFSPPDIDPVFVDCTLIFYNGNPPIHVGVNGLFNMYRPQTTITPLTSSVNVIDVGGGPLLAFGQYQNGVITQGIVFVNTIDIPLTFGGLTSWAQIVTDTHYKVYDAITNHDSVPIGAQPWGDLPTPYEQFDANNNPIDSPTRPLLSGYNQVDGSGTYMMWMMFTPDGGHEVPLRIVGWHWSGSATNHQDSSGDHWTGGGSGHADSNDETEDYPEWKSDVRNKQWIPPL